MAAIIASIGSVIGYVGAEVAEEAIFERILWPQRFYNFLDASTALKLAIFMSMGGPLHRAALQVLDRFRRQGLYRGRANGHMLGTAFFTHQETVQYLHHTARNSEERHVKKDVRNGFWVEVLMYVDPLAAFSHQAQHCGLNKDEEKAASTGRGPKRTTQYLFRLSLAERTGIPGRKSAAVNEAHITASTVFSILLSETVSIACAVVVTVLDAYYGFTALFCFPLALKLLALPSCVRRESLREGTDEVSQCRTEGELGTASGEDLSLRSFEVTKIGTPLRPGSTSTELFEVLCPSQGLIFIETDQAATMFQFTRHYGHPIRDSRYDRFMEILSMSVIYLFALNFPAGLVALTWAPRRSQYIWIAYQVYVILAMHITRLVGWGRCGRTEERAAKILEQGKEVYLHGKWDMAVRCTLLVERFNSIAEGQARRREILSKLPVN